MSPLGFTLPALLHLKAGLATTRIQQVIDIGIIILSIFFTVFTTEEVFRTWNQVVVYEC